MARIEITFTRTGKKHDWITIARDDGNRMSFPWDARGAGLPHDLVHYVVETTLGMRRGFWGLVAEGLDFAAVDGRATRAANGVLPLRSQAEGDLTELAQAEAIVGSLTTALWLSGGMDDAGCFELLERFCEDRKLPLPPYATRESMRQAREALVAMQERWRALPPGGAVTLAFPAR